MAALLTIINAETKRDMSATKQCTRSRSEYYLDNKNRIPDAFYYPSTSAILLGENDRCTKITNSQLRKQYPWIKSTDEVEHIVDTNNGPEYLEECDKNIRGNLIISIGIWNRQVGNMCWKDVEAEKRTVYGNQIVDYAISSVHICCKKPDPPADISLSNFIAIIFSLAIALLVITLIVVAHHNKKNDDIKIVYKNNIESDIENEDADNLKEINQNN